MYLIEQVVPQQSITYFGLFWLNGNSGMRLKTWSTTSPFSDDLAVWYSMQNDPIKWQSINLLRHTQQRNLTEKDPISGLYFAVWMLSSDDAVIMVQKEATQTAVYDMLWKYRPFHTLISEPFYGPASTTLPQKWIAWRFVLSSQHYKVLWGTSAEW